MPSPRILSLAAGVLPEHNGLVVAEAAAAAGFSHYGVTVDKDWTPALTASVRATAAREQLSCLDVEVVWLDAGAALTDLHRKIIDVGATLGAANVLAVSSEADEGLVAEALHRLCELAAPAGMRVVLEFLRITAITRPSQALRIVRLADHPAAGILVDSLHLARSGESAQVLSGVAELLPYLQLCDGPRDCADDQASLLEDALDRRCAPGEGALPLADSLALAPGCPLSLEVRSRHYRDSYPQPAARAAAIRMQTLKFLDAVEGTSA